MHRRPGVTYVAAGANILVVHGRPTRAHSSRIGPYSRRRRRRQIKRLCLADHPLWPPTEADGSQWLCSGWLALLGARQPRRTPHWWPAAHDNTWAAGSACSEGIGANAWLGAAWSVATAVFLLSPPCSNPEIASRARIGIPRGVGGLFTMLHTPGNTPS